MSTAMKTKRTRDLLAAALVGALALSNAHAQEFTPDQLQQRTLERRAVETAIWGMPSGRPATSPAKKQTNQSTTERTQPSKQKPDSPPRSFARWH
jgi:hypothetical protein